jgi:capsular polysaccharide biosynthesis protein
LNHQFSAFIPSTYRQKIYDVFLPQRARVKNKIIFISRAESYNQRHVTNELELIKVLEKFGFQKYILEKMSLPEQTELFYDADAVVAPHGAGLSNIIFSENIKVIELFPYPFVIPYFYYLAKSMGHTYQYWCGNYQYKDAQGWNDNFFVDVPELQQILESLF